MFVCKCIVDSATFAGMSPATHKPQSSNLSSKKNPVDGGEEISWEYDLSDRYRVYALVQFVLCTSVLTKMA